MGYNLPINGIYWGYNPLTNHLLTSRDIQVWFSKTVLKLPTRKTPHRLFLRLDALAVNEALNQDDMKEVLQIASGQKGYALDD